MIKDELRGLQYLVKMIEKDARVVIIGNTVSAVDLLEERNDINLYAIYETEEEARAQMELLHASGILLKGRYMPFIGDSVELGLLWERGDIHMLFICGDIQQNFKTWLEYIGVTGTVVFSEYNENQEIIDELMDTHNEILHIEGLIAFEVN